MKSSLVSLLWPQSVIDCSFDWRCKVMVPKLSLRNPGKLLITSRFSSKYQLYTLLPYHRYRPYKATRAISISSSLDRQLVSAHHQRLIYTADGEEGTNQALRARLSAPGSRCAEASIGPRYCVGSPTQKPASLPRRAAPKAEMSFEEQWTWAECRRSYDATECSS